MSDRWVGATATIDTDGRPRPAGELVLVTTAAICARRHPWAVVGVWAWQTFVALVASWPAASLVGASYGRDPTGDARLWDAGGHALLDWLWHESHGVTAVTRAAAFALAVAAIAGLVPLGALMSAMTYATREGRPAGFVAILASGLRAFKALAVLLVAFGAAEAAVLGMGAGAATLAQTWSRPSLGEAHAEAVEGVVAILFVGLASGVGVMHDVARAVVVRFKVRGLRALVLGARTFRASPARLWWSWAWRTAAAAALVVVVAGVAGRLGGRGGLALAFVALLHQSVALSRVALRASWLGRALRAVDTKVTRDA